MPGITGEPAVDAAKDSKGGGSFLDELGHLLAGLTGPALAKDTFGGKSAPKKADPKKKTTAKKKTTDAPAQGDAFEQLAKSLVGELQEEQAPIEAAISGSLTGPAAATAEGIADSAVGVSPDSATGQYMANLVGKGQQQSDPLTEALGAYGLAYGASQVGVDQALLNMGAANDAAVNDAPEDAWLNAIASHIGTTQSGYYSVPENIAKALPAPVAQALQGAGFGGISTPKGGWGPGALQENSSIAAGLTGLGNTTPGSVPTQQAVTNPSNPAA